jgi:starch phosphorylase
MGHLAFVGSHRVNGVSALHTDLMRRTVFADLDHLYPGRIVNKTNGITFRRWLHQANPGLTALLIGACGEKVLDDAEAMASLSAHADDAAMHEEFAAVRLANKVALERLIRNTLEIRLDPRALFDVQIKRIHEYKRQLLNLLETAALYDAIRAAPSREWTPRVKIFAGKAAATYAQAKLIIRLAHDIGNRINNDPLVRDLLKVIFLPNYNVSLAEVIIPAADLSEQISTAGMEASGTGNMKLALNGALTIGTYDGANIEISERVGRESMFIFGMTADTVRERWTKGFDSAAAIESSPALREVIAALSVGVYSPGDPNRYLPIINALRQNDRFLVTADFDAYWAAQRQVDAAWTDTRGWWRASILNTANVAWFSSDRAIREYAADIWNVPIQAAPI